MEELAEGLKALTEMGTPQEHQQIQLTWTPGSSQRLSHQPKSTHGLDQRPPSTYVADVQLSLHVGPPTTGAWAVFNAVACLWNTFPLTGLPGLASVREDWPNPAET